MNNFGIDLTGKQAVFKARSFYLPNASAKDRTFLCVGGPGCNPEGGARQITGSWLSDSAMDTIDSYQLESVVSGGKVLTPVEKSEPVEVQVAQAATTTPEKRKTVRRKR